MHYKTSDEPAKVASYLEDLYGLQIKTSKINKPIIGVAPGHAFNSGAAFLAATGLPTVTLDTKVSFNDVSFGFVPHGGSTYYLSRLPGELGTFLALTGFPMTGIDARELGMADMLVHYSKAYEEELTDILFAMEFPIPNYDLLSNKGRYGPRNQEILERLEEDNKKQLADHFERARQKQDNIIHEEFMEPKDKVPSMTADADYNYKQMIEKYNLRFKESQEPGYFESYDGIYQNYYDYVLGYVKSHSGHDYPRTSTILKNMTDINRLFRFSTLEEITDALRREESEGSKFAAACLKKMTSNSQLSMKLALKMVREARNLDYKGSLEQEINVALNKIQDKEFDIGMTEVLMKPGKPEGNPGFSSNVSADQVNSYFSPNKWAKEVQLDVVEKAMLPTRFYYEKFTDQVRLWINEESTPQPEVRDYFDTELKEALREHGIDIRDRALTIASAREHLFKAEQHERRQKAFDDRLTQLLTDDKLRS
jgi:enoyl-CoA hydratase/carnithine racemase